MTGRAERLGLEPGSVEYARSERGSNLPPSQIEIAHSIAISLKRIADLEERMLLLHEKQTTLMEGKAQP